VNQDVKPIQNYYGFTTVDPVSSVYGGLEFFDRNDRLSLQTGLTYNYEGMIDRFDGGGGNLKTYMPSLMVKACPLGFARWLWGGVRVGAVRLVRSDHLYEFGKGHGAGWGYMTQANLITYFTSLRPLAISAEVGYQFAKVNHVRFTSDGGFGGAVDFRQNYDLSGLRIAVGVSVFP
jgi:hypothetical protein